MYKSIKYRITLVTSIIFIGFILLVAMASNFIFKDFLMDYYYQLLQKNDQSIINNYKIYVTLIEESAKQIGTNSKVFDLLKNNNTEGNITEILDGIKLSNTRILAVILYDTNGRYYTSSYVVDYPTLSELLKDKRIKEFVANDKKQSLWLIRNRGLAPYYNNTYYKSAYGVVSFISKIYDENKRLCGYLVIDIDPKYFYQRHFGVSDHADISVYLYDKDIGLLPRQDEQTQTLLKLSSVIKNRKIDTNTLKKENSLIRIDDNTLLDIVRIFESGYIVILYDISEFGRDILTYTILIVIVSSLLIGMSFLSSTILTQTIYKPLINLVDKIRKYNYSS
ncbi:hypothetical protein Calhy_0075 [Caldicellulosiruptor hydrothermalis 108]|uniref:Cache domain-containing protein n=1 Tax=Caldicellulosiruptor hydrothermalis (strain DSM 18901 / VKM B-2411 / 108) TaxID=632292 RepID=E4Q9G6_CALH1|nr:cache domain-containing protein [Caldicellulosiruptor hydrothermalis]ADQ05837.1 hypothetical protein Calhy_0075 [Caldicellulosiruptor hydrothermalis 108]